MDIGYLVVAGILSMIGMFVSGRLKSKFNKYSQVNLQSGMSGKEVAEQMLAYYNIHDVRVVPAKGFLTDHYNPLTKTVALSEPVYNARTISAAAVAAHECGHAVQHDTAYGMLKMRSALVPVVKVAAMAQQGLLMVAFLMLNQFPMLMLITIAAFAMTALFSFVTLPVEFDASNRALAWLEDTGVTREKEHEGAKDALWWAAMTYVAAALSSLVMVLYLILQYTGRRR
ncbi:MAG: zinc metallopeptidase [Saprospiraceae bacterium]